MDKRAATISSLAFGTFFALAGPVLGQSPATEAEAEIRRWPQVIDLVHQPEQVVQWIIGVKDDGTKRYGLAMSICDTLKEHGAIADDTVVRIVDFAKFMSTKGDHHAASLGSVECATYQHRDP